jgi:predicted phosphatase
MIEYYNKVIPKEEEKLPNIEEEEKFKGNVKTYFEDKQKLGWRERGQVKKWLKNLNKAIKVLDTAILGLKKEYDYIIQEQAKKGIKIEDELRDLKEEIVDRIIDTKEIIYIEDPNTKVEATKESLNKCNINQLIKLMEDNVEILNETVNGKIKDD